MEIQIENSNRFGKLKLSDLGSFERSLGAMLPDEYRSHLLRHNGGCVKGVRRLCLLDHVYGIHDGPNWARFPDTSKIYGGLVPRHVLPVADDPGGNLICVAVSGRKRGAVYFWDHECGRDSESGLRFLAESFSAYLRGLSIYVLIAKKKLKTVGKVLEKIGINTPVYANKTGLDLTLERGSLRMVKTVVAAGAKIRPDALLETVRNDAPNATKFILSCGVDLNFAIPETGFTALMLAASRDTVEIANFLLDRGADRNLENKWGKTAADLAHSDEMKRTLNRNR